MNITFKELDRLHKFFSDIKKADVDGSLFMAQRYNQTTYQMDIFPEIRELTVYDLVRAAKVCQKLKRPIYSNEVDSTAWTKLVEDRRHGANYLPTCADVQPADNIKYPSVKFYSSHTSRQLANSHLCNLILIEAPLQFLENGITYRTIYGSHTGSVFVVSHEEPLYNYLDQGHLLITNTSNKADTQLTVVANQLTLDVNYILGLLSYCPRLAKDFLQDGVFIRAETARLTLIKMEKALPLVHQANYRVFKNEVLKDFEQNAQNALVSQLVKKEIGAITLNDIKIKADSATYETITIEAPDLMAIVFSKINPNEPFDIYTMVTAYGEYITEQITTMPLDQTLSGFTEAKTWTVRINGFDVSVGIHTSHARRSINGKYINIDELAPVFRRATCFKNQEDYDKFVASVAYQSLDVHNILANGLPIKIAIKDSYQECRMNADAQDFHPKLFFKRKDSKYYMTIGENDYEMKRFVSFCDKVRAVNRHTNNRYKWLTDAETSDGRANYGYKDAKWCCIHVKRLIREHVKGIEAADLEAITDKVLDKHLEDAKVRQEEAMKRSEKLLQDVIKETKAKLVTWSPAGKTGALIKGYEVAGKKRNYFISETDNKVYNKDTGGYICIVNGNSDQGYGKDALVSRILAVFNDSVIVNKITTLNG